MEKSIIYEKFLDVIESKFTSESTLNTYANVANKFIYSHHPNSVECLTNKYLKRFLLDIKTAKSVSSYNQYLSVIKIIYRDVLRQKQKIDSIKPIKQNRKLKVLPTKRLIGEVLNNISNIKHYTIILTFICTGIRISELLNIRILDVDSDNKRILIFKGKGDVSRYVDLNNTLLEQLKRYYMRYKPKYYLFGDSKGNRYSKSSVNKFIKKYFGESYHAHLFRHYWFTYMINNDINPQKLKHMGGHRSQKSTDWYYQYSEESLEHDINPVNELILN